MRVSWTPYKHVDMNRVEELLKESFRTKQLTNYGPNVKRLEQFIRERLQIDDDRAVIATCNATVSLDIVARGIDLLTSIDNKWCTSSFTFPSSAQVKGGGSIVIVDVDSSHGLDLKSERLNEVNGIFATNVFGNSMDIEKYEEYAVRNKKYLVFDNAACLHTLYKGKSIHNYGHASVLSLHQTKAGGLGEGSILFTSRQLEPFCRRLLNFGIDNCSFNPVWEPIGMNGKMSDIAASFILSYLEENFDHIVSHHRSLYESFSYKLQRFGDRVKLFPDFSDRASPVVPCFCIIFDKKTDHLIKMFSNSGFQTRAYYNPLDRSCNNSVKLHETIICLPCHTDVTLEILDEYVEIIENFLDEN